MIPGASRGSAVVRGLELGPERASLQALVRSRDVLIVPGVVDALTARLVEQAGFQACYVTGAGIANVHLGLPDVGLATLSEVTDRVRQIADAVSIPVLVDGDTGHGGPLSVMRTVHLFEQAGAGGIQLEDQSMPKRCGHLDGVNLVTEREMVIRIRAAVRARSSQDFLVVARTDALGIEGIDRAIERARTYAEAGGDVLFIEAPTSEDELIRIGKRLGDFPLLVNIVEGGRTPELPASQLQQMGFSVVLHANLLMRIMAKAAQSALGHLAHTGETRSLHDEMLTWAERQELVGLHKAEAIEVELESD